jgi:hypothetical protein
LVERLGLVPSGKAPHYDASVGEVNGLTFGAVRATGPSAEDLVDSFLAAPYTVERNRQFKQDPG